MHVSTLTHTLTHTAHTDPARRKKLQDIVKNIERERANVGESANDYIGDPSNRQKEKKLGLCVFVFVCVSVCGWVCVLVGVCVCFCVCSGGVPVCL